MLVLEIEASKPPRNDLKSGQRYRNDPFVYRKGVISPSKTKQHDQTTNTKCRNSDLYGGMGMRK